MRGLGWLAAASLWSASSASASVSASSSPSISLTDTSTSSSSDLLRRWPPGATQADLIDYYVKERPLLYFLHIPKAAGQSFQTVIQDILEWPTKAFVESLDTEKVIGDLNTLAPNWAGEMYSFNETRRTFGKLDGDRKPFREPALRFDMTFASYDTINDLMARPERIAQAEYMAVTQRRLVVVSHADVRLGDVSEPKRPTEIITMLRNPLERQISWYCFIRQLLTVWAQPRGATGPNPGWSGHKHWCKRVAYSHPHFLAGEPGACSDVNMSDNATEPLSTVNADSNAGAVVDVPTDRDIGIEHSFPASVESFKKFVLANRDDTLDNYMTRAYAGCLAFTISHTSPPECSDPEAMLDLAKRNLSKFLFVGITERYEDSVRLLEHTMRYDGVCFPWERPKHLPKSQPTKPLKKALSPERPQPGMRSTRGRRMIRNTTQRKDDCVEALMVLEGPEDADDDDQEPLELEPEYEQAVIDIVSEVDGLDFELYDFAKALFDQRLARMKEDNDLGL